MGVLLYLVKFFVTRDVKCVLPEALKFGGTPLSIFSRQ
jgi:hypothetical protein